ncbi:unnamed protein product [Didymodactylos carnosus]|uniref:Uncharacterized protein n=1 Tax=Didymodactylos carnosus TaxID=1234261 RepID=A0A813XEP0_9BILA|nr:unnamed protein product [Didymodactylos carnosus]CAF1177097.1 unnamed protein product [Didymodactylos carnosus]CAF3657805.1 unnamed protein product [Didymodactylos carnosus]CAF3988335.1 unnamed protein product [Didymodactylos carnosus]
MGTTESSQSSELGQTFHRQSPNVARLIHSENSRSPQMEYEFPIDGHLSHSHHRRGLGFSSSSSSSSHHHSTHENNNLTTNTTNNLHQDNIQTHNNKQSTDSVWLSFTSCFGCGSRHSHTPPSPMREKVHAIRIVRASNDLTPAVFDSHYNIITLEQLRECDQTGGNNNNDLINNSSNGQDNNNNTDGQNGNNHTSYSFNTITNSAQSGRTKKKKKRGNSSTSGGGDETVSSPTSTESMANHHIDDEAFPLVDHDCYSTTHEIPSHSKLTIPKRLSRFNFLSNYDDTSLLSFDRNLSTTNISSKWTIVRQRLPDILAMSETYRPRTVKAQIYFLRALMHYRELMSEQEMKFNEDDNTITNVVVDVCGRKRTIKLKRIPADQYVHVDIDDINFDIPTRQFIMAMSANHHRSFDNTPLAFITNIVLDVSKSKIVKEDQQQKRQRLEFKFVRSTFIVYVLFIGFMVILALISATSTVLKMKNFYEISKQ